ncbi:uncharacterized protein LOC110182475 isoform X2 [Drosophila serrata]|nr:uncharacterized protein LOC110182475 isoform X2 [Drosophila serrata]
MRVNTHIWAYSNNNLCYIFLFWSKYVKARDFTFKLIWTPFEWPFLDEVTRPINMSLGLTEECQREGGRNGLRGGRDGPSGKPNPCRLVWRTKGIRVPSAGDNGLITKI